MKRIGGFRGCAAIRAGALAALAACAAGGGTGEQGRGLGIAGDWVLVTLDGRPLGGSASLSIAPDGAIEGQAPCNLFTAQNGVVPPGFRLDSLDLTDRQCLWDGGEGRFIAALSAATTAEPVKGGLMLAGPRGELRFQPAS